MPLDAPLQVAAAAASAIERVAGATGTVAVRCLDPLQRASHSCTLGVIRCHGLRGRHR